MVRGSFIFIFRNIPIFSCAGEGLEKIKSKNWAEPLGIGLQVTGEIFELAGEAGLPVIGLIGNMREIGPELLNVDNILPPRNLSEGWL